MDVGKTLTKIMELEGLTATSICEISGVSCGMFSKYVHNTTSLLFTVFLRMITPLGYAPVLITPGGTRLYFSTIGSVIKYILKTEGISLKELSRRSDIGSSNIHNYIIGRQQPTMRQINKLLSCVRYDMKVKKKKE